MTVSSAMMRRILRRLLDEGQPVEMLGPRPPSAEPLPRRIPAGNDYTAEGTEKRRAFLRGRGIETGQLAGRGPEIASEDLAGNIENFIGFARMPVGVIGPLRVNGTYAHGDFYVPLATTEGALVASCARGAHVVSLSGGASVICLTAVVSRAPCFVFRNLVEAGQFLAWLLSQLDGLQEIVAATSRHCRFADIRPSYVGKEVHVLFDFTTGDASGQNMVTLATQAICTHLLETSPIKPRYWFIEGNMSGDKKATMAAFAYARGKKVVAEAVVQEKLLRRFIHAGPADLVRYVMTAGLGASLSGSIGAQGHYANPLAAIFAACGQDIACVSEASVGVTRMSLTDAGDLYASVMLPNLIVGTVGGGTRMPTARECLAMMGCRGDGTANKFAEICAAATLAAEISIIGALAAGEFAQAHATYGRRSKPGGQGADATAPD